MKQEPMRKPTQDALQSKSRGVKGKSSSKIPKRVKQPSKKTIKDKAWRAFSKYIRLRDCLKTTGSLEYGECVSCDRTFPFALLDAGHFIPRKSGNYFSERGVNAQCRSCNRFHGGNQLEYRKEIIRRYGEGIDLELEEEARQIRKYTPQDLVALAEEYKNKTNELLKMKLKG